MLKKGVLRGKSNFAAVYKKGKSTPDRYVVLFKKRNGLSYNRIAFLASKKVGNSVQRNRARRLMRESFRLSCKKIKEGYDIVFVARNSINNRKLGDVDMSMKRAVKKSGLMI